MRCTLYSMGKHNDCRNQAGPPARAIFRLVAQMRTSFSIAMALYGYAKSMAMVTTRADSSLLLSRHCLHDLQAALVTTL